MSCEGGVMIQDALAGAFEIPVYFDYPATFIWALSGALLAARLRMDPTGVAIIALVTAAGGGLLRDGLFSPGRPPGTASHPGVHRPDWDCHRDRQRRRSRRAPHTALRPNRGAHRRLRAGSVRHRRAGTLPLAGAQRSGRDFRWHRQWRRRRLAAR